MSLAGWRCAVEAAYLASLHQTRHSLAPVRFAQAISTIQHHWKQAFYRMILAAYSDLHHSPSFEAGAHLAIYSAPASRLFYQRSDGTDSPDTGTERAQSGFESPLTHTVARREQALPGRAGSGSSAAADRPQLRGSWQTGCVRGASISSQGAHHTFAAAVGDEGLAAGALLTVAGARAALLQVGLLLFAVGGRVLGMVSAGTAAVNLAKASALKSASRCAIDVEGR